MELEFTVEITSAIATYIFHGPYAMVWATEPVLTT